MMNREPRKDWTLDSEGSSREGESTYDDRTQRARSVGERARALLKGGDRARKGSPGIERDRG